MTGTTQPYVPQRGRRAQDRRRRRQRRRRIVALVVAAAAVAAVAVAVVLVQRAPAPPSEIPPQARTQRTLLVQVRGGDGTAVASVLFAHDPAARTGAGILVPPQVIVDVPGSGSGPFGRALGADPAGARNALSDLLGVTIDGSWVLDSAAFTALVDALGGVQATADVPVVQAGQVIVAAGSARLDGARALALATYLAPGEPEQSRLARLKSVLDGLLAALPADAAGVAARLSALGTGSTSTVSDTAQLLAGLKADAAASALQYDSLPVIPIDVGGGVNALRVDAAAARQLVDRALAQSVPPSARKAGNRVLVLNGVGTPGLGDAVRSKLVANNFVFVGSRNADRFGYLTTQVLVPAATPEQQALGEKVAKALGVKGEVKQANLGTVADVVVIVGSDFTP